MHAARVFVGWGQGEWWGLTGQRLGSRLEQHDHVAHGLWERALWGEHMGEEGEGEQAEGACGAAQDVRWAQRCVHHTRQGARQPV